jgi:hypothetical protein
LRGDLHALVEGKLPFELQLAFGLGQGGEGRVAGEASMSWGAGQLGPVGGGLGSGRTLVRQDQQACQQKVYYEQSTAESERLLWEQQRVVLPTYP